MFFEAWSQQAVLKDVWKSHSTVSKDWHKSQKPVSKASHPSQRDSLTPDLHGVTRECPQDQTTHFRAHARAGQREQQNEQHSEQHSEQSRAWGGCALRVESLYLVSGLTSLISLALSSVSLVSPVFHLCVSVSLVSCLPVCWLVPRGSRISCFFCHFVYALA